MNLFAIRLRVQRGYLERLLCLYSESFKYFPPLDMPHWPILSWLLFFLLSKGDSCPDRRMAQTLQFIKCLHCTHTLTTAVQATALRSHSWTWQCHMKVGRHSNINEEVKLNRSSYRPATLNKKPFCPLSFSTCPCLLGNSRQKHFPCLKVSHSVENFLPVADKKRRPHICHQKQGMRRNCQRVKKAF